MDVGDSSNGLMLPAVFEEVSFLARTQSYTSNVLGWRVAGMTDILLLTVLL